VKHYLLKNVHKQLNDFDLVLLRECFKYLTNTNQLMINISKKSHKVQYKQNKWLEQCQILSLLTHFLSALHQPLQRPL
jgi:hypothetical protein